MVLRLAQRGFMPLSNAALVPRSWALLLMCYTEKATEARHRPERQ